MQQFKEILDLFKCKYMYIIQEHHHGNDAKVKRHRSDEPSTGVLELLKYARISFRFWP